MPFAFKLIHSLHEFIVRSSSKPIYFDIASLYHPVNTTHLRVNGYVVSSNGKILNPSTPGRTIPTFTLVPFSPRKAF